jgi:hypothetical protein
MAHQPIMINIGHDDLKSEESFLDRDDDEPIKPAVVIKRPVITKPPSIIELDEPHFKALMRKIYDSKDTAKHGFMEGSARNIQLGRQIARRFLQADTRKFSNLEINKYLQSMEQCFKIVSASSGNDYTFADLYKGARKWWFTNHLKTKSTRALPMRRKMTEN